jgi:hypothetical protein
LRTEVNYNLVTIINQSTGNISSATVPGNYTDTEEIAEEAFGDRFVVKKVRKGLTEEKFLDHDYTRPWMVKRIESVTGVDFEHVMRKGVPDFVVCRKERRRLSFVEVKKAEGGLRNSQLQWMRLFDDAPVKIAYVEPSDHLNDPTRYG